MEELPITPFVQALVICDAIWVDPYTGKRTIIGTFSAITGTAFPIRHPILSVYAALTDGKGQQALKIELVDVDEEREPVFEQGAIIELPEPRAVLEIQFQIMNPIFPLPGEYRLKLSVNNEFLMERRILAIQTNEKIEED